ncbi:MAG: very short patch repair endonuclease [Candidatus Paceibacterota bacterium]|jgi:DNA mismatch endonuclease (patch repair protein)
MDNLTKAQRRKNMQNIRSIGTSPEIAVMRELRRLNIYFARNVRSIIGKPDIVFRRKKTAVFIDSDFWHGHPSRYIKPKSNVSYWQDKVKRNRRRDKEVTSALRKEGWKVLRFWESDIKRSLPKCVKRITRHL